MEAADSLFGEVGFDAATTREIAERSDVNKALIHYHFDSKEKLLRAVLTRYYENLAATVTDSLSGDESLRERMMRLIETYIDFLDKNRNFSRIVQREATGGKNMELVQRHMEPLFEIGRTLTWQAYPQTKKGPWQRNRFWSVFME